MSGCHDAGTKSDGVELTTYEKIISTGDIRPGDPEGSDVYEMITEDNPEERMPKGMGPLPPEQIELIRKWIGQGAKNNSCEEATCDTTNVTFSGTINPIFQQNCIGCHNIDLQNGGYDFSTYAGINSSVANDVLLKAITHSDPSNVTPMPYNLPKLDQCKIDQITKWVKEGALNN